MKEETMEHEISQPHLRATSSGTVNLPAARQLDRQENPGDDDRGILNQVRDLLFADQARETDERLQAIETRSLGCSRKWPLNSKRKKVGSRKAPINAVQATSAHREIVSE